MTKPCNFPNRVNERRKEALARRLMRPSDKPQVAEEIASLQARIKPTEAEPRYRLGMVDAPRTRAARQASESPPNPAPRS